MIPTRITGISRLVTNVPGGEGPLGIVERAVIDIVGGRVTWAGASSEAPPPQGTIIDVEGRAVMPGFVDPHTHLVFAGDRASEFGLRSSGASYASIHESGGGIMSTVRSTRAATDAGLLDGSVARARSMLATGTTTVEVKSGYGLDLETEVRILEVAARIAAEVPIDVVRTFLGAHAVPAGVDRNEYLDRVVNEMIPVCAPLARYIDVFCDSGAFAVEETRRVLEAGVAAGFRPRIHAEQLSYTGAAALAADMDAASADHLDHLDAAGAEAMAQHGVVAVLLPGAALSMRADPPPYRLLEERGVTVALATDCNPGTSYWLSMQSMAALAVGLFGMTPAKAIWSATRGGALALEESRKGIVTAGAVADLLVIDADDPIHLVYRPDTDLVWGVFKSGERVV